MFSHRQRDLSKSIKSHWTSLVNYLWISKSKYLNSYILFKKDVYYVKFPLNIYVVNHIVIIGKVIKYFVVKEITDKLVKEVAKRIILNDIGLL